MQARFEWRQHQQLFSNPRLLVTSSVPLPGEEAYEEGAEGDNFDTGLISVNGAGGLTAGQKM